MKTFEYRHQTAIVKAKPAQKRFGGVASLSRRARLKSPHETNSWPGPCCQMAWLETLQVAVPRAYPKVRRRAHFSSRNRRRRRSINIVDRAIIKEAPIF